MIAGLDLNLLRVFDAVMAEKSVTRAANNLHITQPAVSNALSKLRYLLDDPLFIKTHGGVSPTQKAQLIWPIIRESLEKLINVLSNSDFSPSTAHAEFRISMSEYVASQAVRPLYQALHSDAPNIKLHISPFIIHDSATQLERGEIDLAVGVYTGQARSLRTLAFETMHFAFVVKKGHPLAAIENLSMERFLGANHLRVNRFGTADSLPIVDKELLAAGLQRNVVFTVNSFSLVPEMLVNSELVSILPTGIVLNSDDAKYLQIIEPPFKFQPRAISLIWHERSDGLNAHIWLRQEVMKAVKSRDSNVSPPWANSIN